MSPTPAFHHNTGNHILGLLYSSNPTQTQKPKIFHPNLTPTMIQLVLQQPIDSPASGDVALSQN